MKFIISLVALLAATVVAAPAAEPEPEPKEASYCGREHGE